MKKFILILCAVAMLGCTAVPPAFSAITEATPRAEYTAAGGDTYQCADTGDASQGWPIWVKGDLRVWLDGTLQVVDTDYTVTFTAGDDTDCSITFVSTPTVGLVVAMERASDQEKASDFATSGPFSMASLNSQVDYLTTLVQDNKVRIDRTARLAPGEAEPAVFSRLPAPEASKILGYDSSGNYINYAVTEGGSWDGLADLADNSVGKGSDLVAHTGTADTVTEALAKKLALTGGTMTGTTFLDDGDAVTPGIFWRDVLSDPGATSHMAQYMVDEIFYFVGQYRDVALTDYPLTVDLSTGQVNINGDRALTTADEGTGNGLDADTVDGFHGSAVVGEIVGDGTAGRTLRQVVLTLADGAAVTVQCSAVSAFNGETLAQQDVAKSATAGAFSLNAAGEILTINFTDNIIAAFGGQITANGTGVGYTVGIIDNGADMALVLLSNSTGAKSDLTTVVDAGDLTISLFYLTD